LRRGEGRCRIQNLLIPRTPGYDQEIPMQRGM
jgi:hypothetical protein